MFARFAAAAAFSAIVLSAAPAGAAITHFYQLNGSLADSAGGAAIVNNAGAGSLGATGITFGADLGPTIGGYSSTGVYTVEVAFSFTEIAGYNNIIDFRSGSDPALYVLNGALNFWPIVSAPNVTFTPGQLAHVVVTRDASGNFNGYVGGLQQISFVDTSNRAVIASELRFFNDDGGENSPGFVDYIRTYDRAITAAEAATLAAGGGVDTITGGVPEPATWALMILGFGAAGAMLRRRGGLSARA